MAVGISIEFRNNLVHISPQFLQPIDRMAAKIFDFHRPAAGYGLYVLFRLARLHNLLHGSAQKSLQSLREVHNH